MLLKKGAYRHVFSLGYRPVREVKYIGYTLVIHWLYIGFTLVISYYSKILEILAITMDSHKPWTGNSHSLASVNLWKARGAQKGAQKGASMSSGPKRSPKAGIAFLPLVTCHAERCWKMLKDAGKIPSWKDLWKKNANTTALQQHSFGINCIYFYIFFLEIVSFIFMEVPSQCRTGAWYLILPTSYIPYVSKASFFSFLSGCTALFPPAWQAAPGVVIHSVSPWWWKPTW